MNEVPASHQFSPQTANEFADTAHAILPPAAKPKSRAQTVAGTALMVVIGLGIVGNNVSQSLKSTSRFDAGLVKDAADIFDRCIYTSHGTFWTQAIRNEPGAFLTYGMGVDWKKDSLTVTENEQGEILKRDGMGRAVKLPGYVTQFSAYAPHVTITAEEFATPVMLEKIQPCADKAVAHAQTVRSRYGIKSWYRYLLG